MKCEGCEEELGQAIMYQDEEGLFYATTIDDEFREDEHFLILMVDEDGEIKVM